MKNRFVEWSMKSYTYRQRLMVMIPLGMIFLFAMPALILMSANLDKYLHLPVISLGSAGSIIAVVLLVAGFSIGILTVATQFDQADGTPIPMMPTKKLIVTGPFRYCRNPMALGTILAYFGIVVLASSLSSFVLYLIMISALLAYIKRIEERELEDRFGQEYVKYKEIVPFIIPRRRK